MRVVQAPIQTVEEIYKLVWTAVASRKPVEALYQGRPRLFCPHRLGRNREGQLRVLCYQYTAARAGVDSTRWVHRQIGVVWRWRSSAGFSYWKGPGTARQIIRALPRA